MNRFQLDNPAPVGALACTYVGTGYASKCAPLMCCATSEEYSCLLRLVCHFLQLRSMFIRRSAVALPARVYMHAHAPVF
jgi:hypothetical protein